MPSSALAPPPRALTPVSLMPSCVDGFFGNPVLGSGEHCRPCPCPGSPSSGHFNAHSCQAEPTSDQITCNCKPGYTGTSVAEALMLLVVPMDQSRLCVFPLRAPL